MGTVLLQVGSERCSQVRSEQLKRKPNSPSHKPGSVSQRKTSRDEITCSYAAKTHQVHISDLFQLPSPPIRDTGREDGGERIGSEELINNDLKLL